MEASLKRPFTLVLDEFQEFDRINSAVFSQVAALDDLLALWTVTGGVARYVDMMVGARALTRKKMLGVRFSPGGRFHRCGRSETQLQRTVRSGRFAILPSSHGNGLEFDAGAVD